VPHHRTLGSARGPDTAALAFRLTALRTGFWRACRCTNRVAVVLGAITNRGTEKRHASTADCILRGGLPSFLSQLDSVSRYACFDQWEAWSHSDTLVSFTAHHAAQASRIGTHHSTAERFTSAQHEAAFVLYRGSLAHTSSKVGRCQIRSQPLYPNGLGFLPFTSTSEVLTL
jgi:hypothetical protein